MGHLTTDPFQTSPDTSLTFWLRPSARHNKGAVPVRAPLLVDVSNESSMRWKLEIISYNVRLGDVAAEVRSHQALSSHPVELVAVGASVSAGSDYLERMLVNGQLGRSIYSFGVRTNSAWSTGHHRWRWFSQLHRSLLSGLIIC